MKLLLAILVFPFCSLAQYHIDELITYKATVVSDNETIKGYLVFCTDTGIIICKNKRYQPNSSITIPVKDIRKLEVKSKPATAILGSLFVSVIGFTLTAGLTKNLGDANYDGKTSFWELIFTAIEGTTSSNRRRRNTALGVGAAGGTAAVIIGLIANKKLSLSFPISGRGNFFLGKKSEIDRYIKF
jgi:hypothetical protein